jgi:HAMP domain-containing protein
MKELIKTAIKKVTPELIYQVVDERTEEVITKVDEIKKKQEDDFRYLIQKMDTETGNVRGEIGQLRNEVKGEIGQARSEIGQLKGEIGQLRNEVKSEIGQLRTEFKDDIKRLDGKIDQLNQRIDTIIQMLMTIKQDQK